jgi:hypothetical protein
MVGESSENDGAVRLSTELFLRFELVVYVTTQHTLVCDRIAYARECSAPSMGGNS